VDSNTPIVEIVSVRTWERASILLERIEAGLTVGELRDRLIELAGTAALLRRFPTHIALPPLVGPIPDTVPADWSIRLRYKPSPDPVQSSAAPESSVEADIKDTHQTPGPGPTADNKNRFDQPASGRRRAQICPGCEGPITVTGHCSC
jgi:hypothetical protein